MPIQKWGTASSLRWAAKYTIVNIKPIVLLSNAIVRIIFLTYKQLDLMRQILIWRFYRLKMRSYICKAHVGQVPKEENARDIHMHSVCFIGTPNLVFKNNPIVTWIKKKLCDGNKLNFKNSWNVLYLKRTISQYHLNFFLKMW